MFRGGYGYTLEDGVNQRECKIQGTDNLFRLERPNMGQHD